MKKMFVLLILAIAFTMAPGSSWAANVVVPNVFTPETPARADSVNENFSSLAVDIDAFSPAVIQSATSSAVEITTTTRNITSLTTTPPRDGYMVVTAEGNIEFDQLVADNIQVYVYVTDVSGGQNASGFQRDGFSNAGFATDFSYIFSPLHITNIFPVTGGVSKTFYLTGRESSGAANCDSYVRGKLIALFVPNALP